MHMHRLVAERKRKTGRERSACITTRKERERRGRKREAWKRSERGALKSWESPGLKHTTAGAMLPSAELDKTKDAVGPWLYWAQNYVHMYTVHSVHVHWQREW